MSLIPALSEHDLAAFERSLVTDRQREVWSRASLLLRETAVFAVQTYVRENMEVLNNRRELGRRVSALRRRSAEGRIEEGETSLESLALLAFNNPGRVDELYAYDQLFRIFTETEWKKLLKRRSPQGQAITWSHLRLVLPLFERDASRFWSALEVFFETGMSVREYERYLATCGRLPRRSQVIRAEMSPQAGLSQLRHLTSQFLERLSVWDEAVFRPLLEAQDSAVIQELARPLQDVCQGIIDLDEQLEQIKVKLKLLGEKLESAVRSQDSSTRSEGSGLALGRTCAVTACSDSAGERRLPTAIRPRPAPRYCSVEETLQAEPDNGQSEESGSWPVWPSSEAGQEFHPGGYRIAALSTSLGDRISAPEMHVSESSIAQSKVSQQGNGCVSDNAVSESEIALSESQPLVKRGRGRPRKVAVVAENAVSSVVKRGRGRPRKVVPAGQSAQSEPSAQPLRRGRGRPRKLDGVEPVSAEPQTRRGRPRKNISDGASVETEIVKRGRGRPRKHPASEALLKAAPDSYQVKSEKSDLVSENVGKRSRGRPRKAVQTSSAVRGAPRPLVAK